VHVVEENRTDDDVRERPSGQKRGDEPSEVMLKSVQREHPETLSGDGEAAQASEEGEEPQRPGRETRVDGTRHHPQSVSEISLETHVSGEDATIGSRWARDLPGRRGLRSR